MKYIHKGDKTLAYHVIRKPNKNVYYRIKEGMIVVSANRYVSYERIEIFIKERFDDFYQKIHQERHLESEDTINLWGHQYHLIVTKGRFSYEISSDVIYVKSLSDDIELIKRHIYQKEIVSMLEIILPKVNENIKVVHLNPIPIHIKYLKSKFGSYHRFNRVITLNSFLARLNPIYLEYVLYHEYAHAIEFNHSKDFYKVLDKLMPNHKLYQKDLKKIALH